MSSLLHLGHGDIPHIKFLVGCFALFVVSSKCETTNEKLNMGNITMPEVEQATHLGKVSSEQQR
jgi:hypothetical protein